MHSLYAYPQLRKTGCRVWCPCNTHEPLAVRLVRHAVHVHVGRHARSDLAPRPWTLTRMFICIQVAQHTDDKAQHTRNVYS